MGNISTHTGAFLGGGTLGAAALTIMTGQFHMDAGIAGAWMVLVAGCIGGPVLAFLAVKTQGNPALAAALNAITAISAQQQQTGDSPTGQPEVKATVTATGGAPATATVSATAPLTASGELGTGASSILVPPRPQGA